MIYKPRHFDLKELVCPDIYAKFGQIAWQFFDDKMLMTLDLLRDQLGPIYVNNWDIKGEFDERGFRCIQCSLVKKAIKDKRLYVSPHMTGQGVDFDVEGMSAGEVRIWILSNQIKLGFPIRLEKNVSWVHLDTRDAGHKVTLISPS
jgi:hypothetical protein